MPVEKLSFGKQIAYASGMIGWSITTNLILVMLEYFYLPPSGSGLTPYIPQLLLFGGLNIMSVVLSSGRLIDAFYDPYIASLTDKSNNPKGRRIPFMKWAILPAIIFCGLTFYPIVKGESINNAYWLIFTLIGFFMGFTSYIIPYNALLPELADTAAEKVKLSSFQQVGFVIGIIISSLVNNFADVVQRSFNIVHRDAALQYTIWGLCAVAGITLLIPVLAIDENKYVINKRPSDIPVLQAIRKTFTQRNFKYYLISDFSFYMALSIISSGLLYFIKVLLQLPESIGGLLMLTMVLGSLAFYPLINYLSKKWGKKPLVLLSFALLAVTFSMIFFLGKFPFSHTAQAYILMLLAAFPLASLGILPTAILAEIAEKDARETGENREGMFFAVKFLFIKFGQTFGIALSAFLTVYGKDPGHDYGLRLNGVCGFILCAIAFIFFTRFREARPQVKPTVK
jgi:GPH family glycoside/pentoside/hexuronide:cation symporter